MARSLQSYQYTIFATMFIGYGFYAYNRKSVSFALPKLIELGMQKSDAGLIISSQNLAYAISKFLGGVLSDRISSRLLFSTGLLLSGVATLVFSASHSVTAFVALWFLNGFAQGCGWPACAKVIRQWFSPAQFGTWWSVMSASANVSGGVSPFISAYIILNYGWRMSLMIAGSSSIALGIVSVFTIVNSPTDVGFKSFTDSKSKKSSDTNGDEKANWLDLVKSPFLWLVSFCYMIVFCAKTSTVDWSQLYLLDDVGQSQIVGSAFVSSVETGGFFGGVFAGYLTDLVLKRNLKQGKTARGNPRMKVGILFMLGVAICLHLLKFFVGPSSSKLWIVFIGSALGACLYGPIAIYGVVATESAPTHLSGTAHAIVALAANVGAIVSGYPFSLIAKNYSWGAIFVIVEMITGFTCLLMILTRNMNPDVGKVKRN